MSNVARWNFYKKQKCANCGYYWDYPFTNVSAMSAIQNMFYFEVHYCPNCKSVGDYITEVGELELKIQEDKEYKQIIKERNIPFSMAYRKESYKYVLFAYICEKKNDYFKASKAYFMASRVENYQRLKYIDSMLYNEQNDAKMLTKSEENETEYLNKSVLFMQKYVLNNENDIDAQIMLAFLYKLTSKGEDAILLLNRVMKTQLTPKQIEAVKYVVDMKLGFTDFFLINQKYS